ncbi:MAG: rRNA maturation RNase YbeY [Ruminococcaceae bacterium]|nr:rRNA maturation RNase YbeY [Oscillospiraceae bacterium]MBQ1258767.1 rRNA maturation RNase YbeY [Clostridia bacterium]
MKLKIYFSNDQEKVTLTPDIKGLLVKTVATVIESEKYINNIVISAADKSASLSVTFTDNETIREVNRLNRGIDSETDVLSFPMFEDFIDIEGEFSFGDIMISLEKAVEQAELYDHSFEREVAFLTAHSMLHLIGYDHIEEEDEKIMRAKQREIMKKLHLEV